MSVFLQKSTYLNGQQWSAIIDGIPHNSYIVSERGLKIGGSCVQGYGGIAEVVGSHRAHILLCSLKEKMRCMLYEYVYRMF